VTSGNVLFIGCYTAVSGGQGDGVAAVRRDPRTGGLELIGTIAATPSPSFIARHPALPVLYAANEVADGAVSAWAIEDGPRLRLLAARSTGGAEPCHLAVTPDGQYLVVANYGGGSIAVYPLDRAGVPGELSDLRIHEGRGPDPHRQTAPHVHMASPDPGGGSLLAVDLGVDAIYRYRIEPPGRLLPSGEPVRTEPGTGPRHLARHPNGSRCYLVGELDATVTAYEVGPDGGLREQGRWATSERQGHVQPSEVAVGADGRFLYVANRGVNTLAVFAITDASLRYVAEIDVQGNWPRHFTLWGPHLYVANERSHTVAVFQVDAATGVPEPDGHPLAVASPTCIVVS
jgi:6-phosphogluconolactonase (cycloisomerase 2 family)